MKGQRPQERSNQLNPSLPLTIMYAKHGIDSKSPEHASVNAGTGFNTCFPKDVGSQGKLGGHFIRSLSDTE